MKNIFIYFFLSLVLLLNTENLSAQNKCAKKINYSKYIGKTVEHFFSDFKLPIKDTIPIRDYTGIHRFILDLGEEVSLYITPKVVRDSVSLKRRVDDDFNLSFFYPYKIESIIYKKNGKTMKVYGKYDGRL